MAPSPHKRPREGCQNESLEREHSQTSTDGVPELSDGIGEVEEKKEKEKAQGLEQGDEERRVGLGKKAED